MKLDVKTAAGAAAGTVDVPEDLFGIEPNIGRHAPGRHRPARGRPFRHAQHQDPRRGRGWWREAVAPEGHRPRPSGFDPCAALARRWCGPRPEAPQLLAAHAQEDGAARAALRTVRPCSRRQGPRLDGWGIDTPSTKAALSLLGTLGLRTKGERDDRVLLVLDRTEENVWKSFRNLGERVQIVLPEELNTYDVLVNDWLVFTKATLESVIARFGGAPAESAEGAQEGGDK